MVHRKQTFEPFHALYLVARSYRSFGSKQQLSWLPPQSQKLCQKPTSDMALIVIKVTFNGNNHRGLNSFTDINMTFCPKISI